MEESLNSMKARMTWKQLAKEILLEENYERLMRSYNFLYWFQFWGVTVSLLVPTVVFVLVFHGLDFGLLGLAMGVICMCVVLIISQFLPKARLYIRWDKWYKSTSTHIEDLCEMFK